MVKTWMALTIINGSAGELISFCRRSFVLADNDSAGDGDGLRAASKQPDDDERVGWIVEGVAGRLHACSGKQDTEHSDPERAAV